MVYVLVYEVICDEQESEETFTQHDVENEQLRKKNKQLKKSNVTKDATIKESIKKTVEIKTPEEDKNTTDCFDKNKFRKILDIVDSNKFNHKNKIGE